MELALFSHVAWLGIFVNVGRVGEGAESLATQPPLSAKQYCRAPPLRDNLICAFRNLVRLNKPSTIIDVEACFRRRLPRRTKYLFTPAARNGGGRGVPGRAG